MLDVSQFELGFVASRSPPNAGSLWNSPSPAPLARVSAAHFIIESWIISWGIWARYRGWAASTATSRASPWRRSTFCRLQRQTVDRADPVACLSRYRWHASLPGALVARWRASRANRTFDARKVDHPHGTSPSSPFRALPRICASSGSLCIGRICRKWDRRRAERPCGSSDGPRTTPSGGTLSLRKQKSRINPRFGANLAQLTTRVAGIRLLSYRASKQVRLKTEAADSIKVTCVDSHMVMQRGKLLESSMAMLASVRSFVAIKRRN